ncbi:hypothetical protein I317_04782 [Kwoniella heveanensis CBS 569]|nr:hypothetical protein I317_04782 [Kwoniella heveanensis CBS 569]
MDKGKAKEKTFEHEDFPGLSLPPPPSMMDDDGDEILSEPQVGSPSARANSYPTAQPSNSRSPASFLQPGNEEQSHSDTDDTDTERSRSTSGPTPTQMQQGMPRGGVKRRKRSEPTSPVVVVLYVVALYLIFQILTRSDEHEVLGHLHLPTTSSSFMQSQSPRSNIDVSQQQQPYHLPYQFPPIPNPMPSIPKDKEDGISFWRLLLGILMYPLYLVVTLLATPLPIILNLLHILKEVVEIVLLYPVISVVRAIFWTFVMGPWGVIKGILDIFYPVYVFVGGVVGVGCVMGLGAGWVGRMALDWVIAWKNGTTSGQSGGQRQRSKTAGGATQVQTGSRIGITGNNLSSKSARIDSYGDGGEKDDYDDICKEYQKISTATPSFVSKTISPNSITYLVSAPAVPKWIESDFGFDDFFVKCEI